MPAIALPLNKKTQHVCPVSHVENFERSIDQFDRVIIIGWRGTDDFIINKLKEKLGNRKLTTFVITNNSDSRGQGSDILKQAKTTIKEHYSRIPQLSIQDDNIFFGGFSRFMKNHSNYSKLFEKNLPAIMS
jgi:hypothetical protein